MPSHAHLVLPGRIPGISILVSPWRSAAWTPQVASERAPTPAVSIEEEEEEKGEKEEDSIRDNEGRRTCAIATGFPYV